jgi:hypothetical protein
MDILVIKKIGLILFLATSARGPPGLLYFFGAMARHIDF